MKDMVLIGGGKHCKIVIETLEENKNYRISDISDIKEKIGTKILDYKITISDEELKKIYPKVEYAFISHGKDLNLRKKLFENAEEIGFKLPAISSKYSIFAKNSKIEDGVLLVKGCLINNNATIGKNCIINTGAIIEHDCKIGSHSHISPGAVLSGSVKIGENTHIGANSTIIDGISIGSKSVIGAGSVVIKDIPNNSIAVGSPAKIIKKV